MSNTIKILLGIGGVILIAMFMMVGNYNKMVGLDEQVKTAWSQVENQYQRRVDLIPNLVATVKGFATHESETLENVVKARASATQTNVNVNDAEAMGKFQESQGALTSALSRLMVVVEQYPNLKADQNFMELQAQLEGTENRIAVERKNFNDTVQIYNTFVRSFPNNITAGMFGFEKANQFEAKEGAESAPVVDFTDKN